jgi:hypothetical protein
MPSRSRERRSSGRLDKVARRARQDQLRRENNRPLPFDERRERQRRRRSGPIDSRRAAARTAEPVVVWMPERKLTLAAAALIVVVRANGLPPRVHRRGIGVAERSYGDVQRKREHCNQRCELPPTRATRSHLSHPQLSPRRNIHRERAEILASSRSGLLKDRSLAGWCD